MHPDPTEPTEPTDRAQAAATRSPVPSDEELARVARPATLRRAPRYRAFVVTGALLGLVVALLVVLIAPEGEGGYGPGPTFVFTGLAAALLGALLGGAVAVVLDRAGRR